MTLENFRRVFAKSPIKRIKFEPFIRNVCIALGNTGSKKDLPKLKELCTHKSPLIAEHAQWAIDEITNRNPA
jgi:epoxyqueuosine reductase